MIENANLYLCFPKTHSERQELMTLPLLQRDLYPHHHPKCGYLALSENEPLFPGRLALDPYSLCWKWSGMKNALELLHKSHNARVPYPTMHHFVTDIHVHVCAKFCYKMVHYGIFVIHRGIYEMGLMKHTIWPWVRESHICLSESCSVIG